MSCVTGNLAHLCRSADSIDECFDQVEAVRIWFSAAARGFGGSGPFGEESIGRQAGIERVCPRAVHVDFVCPTGRAQHAQVERRVARLQRVERPYDGIQAHVAGAAALLELEQAADAGALLRWMNAREL